MHDEVSETENIRKNLAIERIIIGGCDILLDVNQVFVRQGNVLQILTAKELRTVRGFRGSFRGGDKELARQCFLFSNHLLIFVRASNGKLQLVDVSTQNTSNFTVKIIAVHFHRIDFHEFVIVTGLRCIFPRVLRLAFLEQMRSSRKLLFIKQVVVKCTWGLRKIRCRLQILGRIKIQECFSGLLKFYDQNLGNALLRH
jgi:hypothetical protein